jgi:flagellar protein FlaG
MVNPIQPVTTPAIPTVEHSERVQTEGESGQGRSPLPQPSPAMPPAQPRPEPESQSVGKGVDFSALEQMLRSMVEGEQVELEFAVDEATQKLVLRVIDAETKQVLQQIPPEIALRIARFVMALLQQDSGIADVRI